MDLYGATALEGKLDFLRLEWLSNLDSLLERPALLIEIFTHFSLTVQKPVVEVRDFHFAID